MGVELSRFATARSALNPLMWMMSMYTRLPTDRPDDFTSLGTTKVLGNFLHFEPKFSICLKGLHRGWISNVEIADRAEQGSLEHNSTRGKLNTSRVSQDDPKETLSEIFGYRGGQVKYALPAGTEEGDQRRHQQR